MAGRRGWGVVRRRAGEVLQGLTDFELEVADPGLGAASLAFLQSFSIVFREGLEAVLLLAAMLGFLASADGGRFRRPVIVGVGAAAVATAVTFVLLGLVLSVAPVQRELLEAVTTGVAVVVLFAVSFWLLSRLEHRRWMEFVRSRLWGAVAAGSALAIAAVGFTAVYREGFETVLFYQALLFFAQGVVEWVVIGFLAGCVALGGVAWAILRAHRRLPLKVFMTSALTLVMLMSVAFLGNAINQLQNLDYLPSTSLIGDVPRLPVFVTQLTGVHPNVEGLIAQAALLVVYAAGFAVLLVASRRARRPRRQGEASLELEVAG
jgi:high-affinity iron transporter